MASKVALMDIKEMSDKMFSNTIGVSDRGTGLAYTIFYGDSVEQLLGLEVANYQKEAISFYGGYVESLKNLMIRDEQAHGEIYSSFLHMSEKEPVSPKEKKSKYRNNLHSMMNKGKRWRS